MGLFMNQFVDDLINIRQLRVVEQLVVHILKNHLELPLRIYGEKSHTSMGIAFELMTYTP